MAADQVPRLRERAVRNGVKQHCRSRHRFQQKQGKLRLRQKVQCRGQREDAQPARHTAAQFFGKARVYGMGFE